MAKKQKKCGKMRKKRKNDDGKPTEIARTLKEIEDSKRMCRIRVHSNEFNFSIPHDSDTAEDGTGSDVDLNVDPNDTSPLKDGTIRDPESTLGHEAVNSLATMQGKRQSLKNKKKSELKATGAENEHRKSKGLKQRKKYGKWNVKQH